MATLLTATAGRIFGVVLRKYFFIYSPVDRLEVSELKKKPIQVKAAMKEKWKRLTYKVAL